MYVLVGGVIGAIVQELADKSAVPVIGFVLGGLLFLMLHEAFKTD
jgi:hypothetical protein